MSLTSYTIIEVIGRVRAHNPGLTEAEMEAVIDARTKYKSAGERDYARDTGCIGDPKLARVPLMPPLETWIAAIHAEAP